MDSNKARTSLLAVAAAAAIALTGTFAWQSISQSALNEAGNPTNPGGRLHDDCNNYGKSDSTKDIYVENFGDEPIYARVRLDEYMEIGQGAGLLKGEEGYETKNVTIVKGGPNADINDMTTWSTHIPDATLNPGTPGVPASTTEDEFHTYWTWTMGGQTVYMPTYNRNKDSLKADKNGTFDGLNSTDDLHYDDYQAYNVGDTKTADEYYDADINNDDECGPLGGPGVNSDGTLDETLKDVSYAAQPGVEHTAKLTEDGVVITMAEYKAMTDAQKKTLNAWVYDADGWAYWSQPIQPETATGLLLDKVELQNAPAQFWHYAIHAVGQFITADDMGQTSLTGFYTDPTDVPSDDARALLDFIGVNTSLVKGAIQITARNQTDNTLVSYVTPGMSVDLSSQVIVSGVTDPDQSVEWTVEGAVSTNTTVVTSGGTPVLVVGSDEKVGNTLTLVVRSTFTDYAGLKSKFTLKVEPVEYTITLTRMVEESYNDASGYDWWKTYYVNSASAPYSDVFADADSRGWINYTEYLNENVGSDSRSFKVTATDNVLVKATVTASDPSIDTSGIAVTLSCDEGGVTFANSTVTTNATTTRLSGGQYNMTSLTMDTGASGTKTITATATIMGGEVTSVPLKLTVAQPNVVINELVANGKCGNSLGGVVNIDGTDFYILKIGPVADSFGTTHNNAALLLTKSEIGRTSLDKTEYNGNSLQTAVINWINSKSSALTSKTIPVDFTTRKSKDTSGGYCDSTEQNAFLLSIADIFADQNGTASSGWSQVTNKFGKAFWAWCSGETLTEKELTPGIEFGELFDLIPDSRHLWHGGGCWFLRTPRNVGISYVGNSGGTNAVAESLCGLADHNNTWIDAIRPALWYDLNA